MKNFHFLFSLGRDETVKGTRTGEPGRKNIEQGSVFGETVNVISYQRYIC